MAQIDGEPIRAKAQIGQAKRKAVIKYNSNMNPERQKQEYFFMSCSLVGS